MKYEITKGSEKDFEDAPEWCTIIYNYGNSDAIRFCNGWKEGCKFSGTKEFLTRQYDVSASDLIRYKIIAERRPITEPVVNQQLTTEWGEDGLPPVGSLCRYRAFSDMPWVECEVLGWHGDDAWLKRTEDGRTFAMGNPELFPIPSTEDVARDEAITGIYNTYMDIEHSDCVAQGIYDAIAAGKIPGITKTPTVSELMRVTENATREDCEAIVKMLSGK